MTKAWEKTIQSQETLANKAERPRWKLSLETSVALALATLLIATPAKWATQFEKLLEGAPNREELASRLQSLWQKAVEVALEKLWVVADLLGPTAAYAGGNPEDDYDAEIARTKKSTATKKARIKQTDEEIRKTNEEIKKTNEEIIQSKEQIKLLNQISEDWKILDAYVRWEIWSSDKAWMRILQDALKRTKSNMGKIANKETRLSVQRVVDAVEKSINWK